MRFEYEFIKIWLTTLVCRSAIKERENLELGRSIVNGQDHNVGMTSTSQATENASGSLLYGLLLIGKFDAVVARSRNTKCV